MPPDYTKWPVKDDVEQRLRAAGINVRADALGLIPSTIADVAAEIGQETKRQFIADAADTTRYFDGSGSAEMEVDEMATFTSAVVIGVQGAPGYALSNVILVSEQQLPQTRLVVGRGSVPAYVTSGVIVPYPSIFPAGRQNIGVTGRFGFGLTVPADLWQRAADEMARRVARAALHTSRGLVVDWMEGDVRQKIALGGADVIWPVTEWRQKLIKYKRPSGRRLRNLKPSMI